MQQTRKYRMVFEKMVQASNELILGLELNRDYAQMTYFHQSVKEPLTVSRTAGEDDYLLPMGLRMDAAGEWHLWDADVQTEEEAVDRFRIFGIYEKIENGTKLQDQEIVYEPEELLAIYIRTCMNFLKLLAQNAEVKVMVTVRDLTKRWSTVLTGALQKLGIDRKQIFMQDYLSSFYYYTVNQKKELWYHDVALIECVDETILGYILHIDHSTRPAVARAELVVSQKMDASVRGEMDDEAWNEERDRLFFELLKKLFERRVVSVSYPIGSYFNKSWAVQSIKFLCFKRHAYQGKNLYSKGACYAAMERSGLIADRGILFGGRDMIRVNLAMEMRIRGKEELYPLVNAGINWYEAHHTCEFIPDGENELRLTSRPITGGEPVLHILRLSGIPKRPNRATRLRMTVYFTAADCCVVEIEDLGFGELCRTSGLTWKREIHF